MDLTTRSRAVAVLCAWLGLSLCLLLLTAPPARATEPPPEEPPAEEPPPAAPAPGTVSLSGPTRAVVGSTQQLTVTLVSTQEDGTGAPVAEAEVLVERQRAGTWEELARPVTGAEGTAIVEVEVLARAEDDRFRATWAGDDRVGPAQSEVHAIEPRRVATSLRLDGPGRVVDETSVRLRMRWRSSDGRSVPGVGVVKVRYGSASWRTHRTVRFDRDGRARVKVSPRRDSRWKVVGRPGTWWAGDASAVHRLDNVPPGTPVALPAGAPRPRVKLPRQARARGAGANATVGRITDGMWRSMVGRSWHQGCPVGRAQLRVVRVNYWGYDGYRYRGELVVRDAIAGKTARVFSAIYRAELPVRAMYRVDRFGWSHRLRGADDYRSMAAGNTSAFNCRGVVGNPGRRSPHSYGRAIDANPWENPYASPFDGWVPNAWWVSRTHPRVAWRSSSHRMVQIMRAHGFRWSYGRSDNHHFDG